MAQSHALYSNGDGKAASRFDPHFTDNVIDATGPKATPRSGRVLGSLIRHAHDFCRENEVTVEEWMAGVEFVRSAPTRCVAAFLLWRAKCGEDPLVLLELLLRGETDAS